MARRIAIIGVNGQVGAELALSLRARQDCEVVGYLRAEYGAALCRLADIPYRLITDALDLSEFDLVVDAAIPSGDNALLRSQSEALAERHLRKARRGATYVYLSSIMAMGMPASGLQARVYRVARTPYSAAKRSVERQCLRAGREYGITVIALRLGQVHGLLQSATKDFAEKLSYPITRTNGSPDDRLNTVFVAELAEFLGSGAALTLAAGIYYAVSRPQWRQSELFDYVRQRFGCSGQVRYELPVRHAAIPRQAIDLAEAYVLGRIPAVAVAVKGWYRTRQAASPPHVADANVLMNLLGPAPEPNVPFALSRHELERQDALVSSLLDQALARAIA